MFVCSVIGHENCYHAGAQVGTRKCLWCGAVVYTYMYVPTDLLAHVMACV